MPRSTVFRCWLPLALLGLSPAAAQAAPPKSAPDGLQYQRVSFSASLGRTSFDTLMRSDVAPGVPGTPVSAEDDLGLDSGKLSGTAELTVRVRGRHRFRIGADYLAMERKGTAQLARDITYGGSVYRISDQVESFVDLRRYSATYLYSPIRNERFELSAGVGVDLIDFTSAIVVPARGVDERDDGTAPAPRLSVEALWRVSGGWYVEARGSYLRGVMTEASGQLKAYSANVVWAWQPGMALSLGYQRYDLEADSRFDSAPGAFRLKTSGPQLAVRVGF